jgi:hypothetical protein
MDTDSSIVKIQVNQVKVAETKCRLRHIEPLKQTALSVTELFYFNMVFYLF